MSDALSSTLAFFGRITDDLRREPAAAGDYRVLLKSPAVEALYKQDGHFVFLDLAPSASAYEFTLLDGLYQGRKFEQTRSSAPPVELTYDGEDEIYVFVSAVNAAAKQITFDAIPFLPVARAGATVLGAGGVSTTLAEDLAGVDVTSAVLASVTGITPGALLRVVRSHCLRAKAGPYYPFPPGITGLRLRVVDGGTGAPIAGAKAHLAKVNGVAPTSTTVAGAVLWHVSLGAQSLVLGNDSDLDVFTEGRGNAVFYFDGQFAITSLALAVSADGYLPLAVVLSLTAGAVASSTVNLTAA